MQPNVIRTVVVTLFCGALCVVGGLASEVKPDHLTPELRHVVESYGLRVVANVPPGVTPIVLRTVAELKQLLDRTDSARTALSATQPRLTADRQLSIGTNCRRYLWKAGGPVYRWNLAANIYISSYGSFTWISSIGGVRFYLSGLTLGVDLTDTWTDSQIDPRNAQSATISGGGVIEWYVFVQSVFVYYSYPVELYGYVNIAL